MKNNNKAIVKKITGRALSSDKKRNFFIIAAIVLTTFMIASVFSIGVSYYESINMREKRMQGSISHMAFNSPTQEQYFKLYSLDYVKTVGLGVLVAQTDDVPGLPGLGMAYIDKTQWEEMFCPTYTNIKGNYPEQENEIMLSRHILDALGISDPVIGMEIPLSYTIDGINEVLTKTFKLSCFYTEYSHIKPGSAGQICASPAFALNSGKLMNENMTVNIIFKNSNNISENIERLKSDLAFTENQGYIQSPAFNDNHGNMTTYAALIAVVAFMMFTGYLLIYNVMYISVSKDVRFFGMLKTLGTTPKQIRRIVVGQILRLCLIGIPVGCVVSAAVSLLIVPAVLTNSSGIDTGAVVSFSPIIYVGAVLFSVLTALVGAITPAKKAANISPVEAMNFTGENINTSSVHSRANGKPHKMAFRNIFRDRKRAFIVILSLSLGIVIFSSAMTIVSSLDIDRAVNADYDYDYYINMKSYSMSSNKDYIEDIKNLPGISEMGVTTLEPAELVYSNALDKYVDWVSKNYNCTKEDAIKYHLGCGLKGIDTLTLREINKTLSVPIDVEAFERGEIALINTGYNNSFKDIADCFTDVSTLNLKSAYEDKSFQIALGGIVPLRRVATFSTSIAGPEILVSNSVMQQYYSDPHILSLDMNVENGYDEQIYNTLDKMNSTSDIEIISRYGARKDMQDAKMIMYTLGGGISCILGLIGIFNFFNVISVGIMVRKRELAALESIGMSKRQMRSMLRNEGLGYAIITLLFSMTFGNMIVFGLFRLFKSIADYAQFAYPLVPVVAICAVIVIICFITPEVAYRSISKMTLVERLREAE